MIRRPPRSTLFPYHDALPIYANAPTGESSTGALATALRQEFGFVPDAFDPTPGVPVQCPEPGPPLTQHKGEFGTCTMHTTTLRSEEHTSELQSQSNLVCRLLL